MNKLKAIAFLLPLSLMVTVSSCLHFGDEEFNNVEYSFVNNSSDTLFLKWYIHHIAKDNQKVKCILSRNDTIFPSQTLEGNFLYLGTADTWENFFKMENIDTIYVGVYPSFVDVKERQIYDLSNDPYLSRIYKLPHENVNLSQKMITIEYP
ncbi:MAG: hypothetical protein GXY64_11595 [Bacteroidales bacterium]|nr:hypothetical protein [Bacteroidales bacterium]